MNFYSESNLKEIEILQLLKEVEDPEVAVNIVDLGLVYKVIYDAAGQITVNMTLSSPSCPMGEMIVTQVEACLKRNFPGFTISVQLVWEPVWSRDFITPAGRKILGY